MPFRKRFRRFGARRRRRLSETYTLINCRTCINVAADATCSNPIIDVVPLLVMSTRKSGSDTTELASPSDKWIVADGLKFQIEYSSNPEDWQQCNNLPPLNDVNNVTFVLTIWEAIIVLPLAQGTSNVPDYVPNLTDGLNQVGDIADRVLWKRLTQMPMWGINTTGAPQLEATMRDVGHGPVVVKSRAKLDDRHGLFLVRNYVHNVAWGLSAIGCNLDCDSMSPTKVIPVVKDEWYKIFYHTRK